MSYSLLPEATTFILSDEWFDKISVDVDLLPLMDGEGKSFRVLGFNRLQRASFVQTLMRSYIILSNILS